MSGLVILPSVGSILTETWLYGDIFCTISNYIESFVAAASIGFLCALNISKLRTLLFPFLARTRTCRSGYALASGIWLLALLPIFPDLFYRRSVHYSPFVYRCDSDSLPHVDTWLNPIKSATLIFLPLCLISVSTVWLLYFVHQVRGLQRQSVTTLILISLAFVLSFLPLGSLLVLGDNIQIGQV